MRLALALLAALALPASVQARTLAARGDVDGAIAKLKTLLAMAHALDSNPIVVQSLVGAGIAEIGLETVEDVQRCPGCPNLYWALADLPRPMFDAPPDVKRREFTLVGLAITSVPTETFASLPAPIVVAYSFVFSARSPVEVPLVT